MKPNPAEVRRERQAAAERERIWQEMHRYHLEPCEVCATAVVGALPGYPARHWICAREGLRP